MPVKKNFRHQIRRQNVHAYNDKIIMESATDRENPFLYPLTIKLRFSCVSLSHSGTYFQKEVSRTMNEMIVDELEKTEEKGLPSPSDPLKMYLSEISRYPVLAREEERKVAILIY
jgi:hypothetical protein